jgi:hypothetical protein
VATRQDLYHSQLSLYVLHFCFGPTKLYTLTRVVATRQDLHPSQLALYYVRHFRFGPAKCVAPPHDSPRHSAQHLCRHYRSMPVLPRDRDIPEPMEIRRCTRLGRRL